jgi:hypothetical protein
MSEISQRYTVYREKKLRTFTLRVDEPFPPQSSVHNVISLGESRPTKFESLTSQHIVVSSITGDAHAFVLSLGCSPSHTWIEKGFQFQRDIITVKIFHVLNAGGVPLDPTRVAVSIEAVLALGVAYMDSTCKQLVDMYHKLFDKWPAFVPASRT